MSLGQAGCIYYALSEILLIYHRQNSPVSGNTEWHLVRPDGCDLHTRVEQITKRLGGTLTFFLFFFFFIKRLHCNEEKPFNLRPQPGGDIPSWAGRSTHHPAHRPWSNSTKFSNANTIASSVSSHLIKADKIFIISCRNIKSFDTFDPLCGIKFHLLF